MSEARPAERLTLGTAGSHDQGSVVARELRHTNLSDLVTNAREGTRDHRLERLLGVGSRLVLELAGGGLLNQVVRLGVGDLDERILLGAKGLSGRNVADTDRESLVGCG